MHDLEDITRLPEDFDGRVRLFPLPELVVFPHAMQPLHIFEPRYCEMLTESLAADRLIAMATLTGGAPAMADGNPPIASTVCVGRIVTHVEVGNDKHNILLVGARRAKIIREIDAGRPFRIAEVEVLDDVYSPGEASLRTELKDELLSAFADVIPVSETVQQSLHDLMAGNMGLGPITDIVAHTLPFEIETKLRLLGEPNVDVRAKRLLSLLEQGSIQIDAVSIKEASIDEAIADPDASDNSSSDHFPPPFSLN